MRVRFLLDAQKENIIKTITVSTEHCFFDYFPVAFRFEDLCLCEVHARKVKEELEGQPNPGLQSTVSTSTESDDPKPGTQSYVDAVTSKGG